jgi:hypothetical protein
MAPGTTNSRHLQHHFQLPHHDVALHLDVTTSQPSGAQERASAKVSQAGMDDAGTDRSRDGGLERMGTTKKDEVSKGMQKKGFMPAK